MRMAGKYGRPLAAIIAAAMVAGAAPAVETSASAPGSAAGGTVIQVGTGRGRLITLARPMSDVFVANDGIADVQVRSPTQIYVFGKKAGETTVSATSKAGAVVFAANVRVGNNFDSLSSMLALAMPDAKVTATPMNGLVLLTGTVGAPEDAAEAERLVQAFVGEETKVLSRLKTATPLQVNLQVRVAEVSRSFIKNIGVNFATRDATGGFLFGVGSGRSPGTIGNVDISKLPQVPVPAPGGGSVNVPYNPFTGQFVDPLRPPTQYGPTKGAERTTLNLAGRLLGLDVLSAIDLGETLGQVTTLANPNLTALSGETATFLAGGEIPIPVSEGFGGITIEYKQYGVSLAYTPTVLSDGRISLRVRPEVSQLSAEGAITLNGVSVPAFSTRRAETTLELGSGQSMMIGGLIQNSHNNQIDKAPGLGDLPILGTLFRSNAFRRSESELVIIITPYLVKPVNNQADIRLPTDGYSAPTDLERVLLGRIDGGKSGEARPVPTIAPSAPAPAPVAPSIGALAPIAPAPVADRREARVTRKFRKGDVAPGFSQ